MLNVFNTTLCRNLLWHELQKGTRAQNTKNIAANGRNIKFN